MPTPSSLEMPPVHRQVRWWILGMLFFVTVINFVDRQTLSVTAPKLREIFTLSNTQYGIIVSAFQLGMVAGEFPMGWLMDRRGARFGLTFAVIWWSIANALHAVAAAMWHFAFFRFWLGTGECGNFSGGVKVVAQWFPVRERAFAVGIFNSASMIGSAVAPFLIVPIMHYYGWKAAFLVPSVLGMVWAFVWHYFYRTPEEHKALTPAEAAYVREGEPPRAEPAPPNAVLLRLPQTWGLMLCRLLVGPVVQFYIYWLPEYLYRQRGFTLTDIAFFAWIPFLFGDIGSIGGGWTAGFLIRRGHSVRAARIITMGAGAALCFLSLAVVLVKTVPVALVAICLVLLGHTALSANMFAAVSDTFPSSAVARVTGLTGVASGLSGMLFPLLTGAPASLRAHRVGGDPHRRRRPDRGDRRAAADHRAPGLPDRGVHRPGHGSRGYVRRRSVSRSAWPGPWRSGGRCRPSWWTRTRPTLAFSWARPPCSAGWRSWRSGCRRTARRGSTR